MTITSPMPKLIETKKDLESLIPGEQVQIRTTNSLYRWFVYEETINNKCSFIARYSSENIAEAIASLRVTEKNFRIRKSDGAIVVQGDHYEEQLYCFIDPEYSQKLKMLQDAGL